MTTAAKFKNGVVVCLFTCARAALAADDLAPVSCGHQIKMTPRADGAYQVEMSQSILTAHNPLRRRIGQLLAIDPSQIESVSVIFPAGTCLQNPAEKALVNCFSYELPPPTDLIPIVVTIFDPASGKTSTRSFAHQALVVIHPSGASQIFEFSIFQSSLAEATVYDKFAALPGRPFCQAD